MKRSLVMMLMIAIIGVFAVAALSATGAQEEWNGPRAGQEAAPYNEAEKVTVEGTVELTAGGVELSANDGTVYELMYPHFLADEVEVKTGDTVSVEGYLVHGPRWETVDKENHLRGATGTVDGEEDDLAGTYGPGYGPAYGPGMMGRRWHGPRGGAYGPGGGGYGPGAGQGAYGPGYCAYGDPGYRSGSGYGPGSGPGNAGPRGGARGPGMMGGYGHRW